MTRELKTGDMVFYAGQRKEIGVLLHCRRMKGSWGDLNMWFIYCTKLGLVQRLEHRLERVEKAC